MPHFAILDDNIGFVQWLGEALSADEAFLAFENEFGGGDGWNPEEFSVYEVTRDDIQKIEEWNAAGHPSIDTPGCLL